MRPLSTARGFRRIALGMNDAVEGAHMGHPDFRAHGRIFATLHPGSTTGMVKLPPEDQTRLVREHPMAFAAENGAWGRAGCTRVQLGAIDEETLGEALTLAWQANAAKTATRTRPPAVTRRRTAPNRRR